MGEEAVAAAGCTQQQGILLLLLGLSKEWPAPHATSKVSILSSNGFYRVRCTFRLSTPWANSPLVDACPQELGMVIR
jgi:hypothetical protein